MAGGLALLLYLRTLAPGVLGGDSGEYQVAAWLAGFVHPTGYPLYLILGWLWTHVIPFGSPAWRMNLLTAICGGLAVGIVYLLAACVLATTNGGELSPAVRRILALFAAACFAVSPTFWSQAIIAESYPLHAAFVAAVLLSLLLWAEHPQVRGLYWTVGLYGLSLTHHRTILLLTPTILVFLLQNRARIKWSRVAPWVMSGLLLAPLALYVYIPLRAPLAPYSQVTLSSGVILNLYRPTLSGFLEYVSGRVFSSALHSPGQALAMLPGAAGLFVREFSWVGIGLGLVGLLGLIWNRRWSVLALTGLSFLALVTFNLFYGIPNIWVYFIAPYLVWTLWMTVGLASLAEMVGRLRTLSSLYQIHGGIYILGAPASSRLRCRLEAGAPRGCDSHLGLSLEAGTTLRAVALGVAIVAFALPAWLLISHYPAIDQSHNHSAGDLWQPILATPLPQGAVLLSNDRNEMVPLLYYQFVQGQRPDLIELYPQILSGRSWSDIGRVAETALGSQRPLYLVKPMPGLDLKFRLAQVGPVWRVAGLQGNRPATAGSWNYGNAMRLIGFDIQPPQPQPGRQATVTLYWQPLGPIPVDYTTYVHMINAGGAKISQSDHVPGGAYYPTSLWQPGEVLEDTHTLALAGDLGAPPYKLVAGLYRHLANGKDLEPLGQPQEIGSLDTP